MTKIKVILLGLFAILLISCGEEENKQSKKPRINRDEVTKLEDEVMRIHDEVMPKMSDIQSLSRRIKARLDSTDHYSPDHIKELKTALSGLREADQAMWDWMYGYNADSIHDKTEKKLYLVDERAEIREVSRKMHNSIEYAKVSLEHGRNSK
jgi:hypothetical protein